MFWLTLVVVLTIGFSFLCSIWESALYSIPPGRVERLKQDGTSRGVKLASLRDHMDRPVSAILTLNTLAHTAGATIAGSLVPVYLGAEYVTAFSIALVFAILVFSEIIPKTIGYAYANFLAPLFAWPIQVLIWSLYPAVIMSEWITNLVKPKVRDSFPTEEDILSIAHLGVRSGGILPEEAKWLRHVLKLNNLEAKDMMTPWSGVLRLGENTKIEELRDRADRLAHARVPVTRADGSDRVVGIALRHEIVAAICEGRDRMNLSHIAVPVQHVPASMKGHSILKDMIRLKQQLFIVVDDDRNPVGLVTIEDVVEAMLGEDLEDGAELYVRI